MLAGIAGGWSQIAFWVTGRRALQEECSTESLRNIFRLPFTQSHCYIWNYSEDHRSKCRDDLESISQRCYLLLMLVHIWKVVLLSQAAGYMRAVLRVIEQCHDNHILHRDIKPGNFMLLNQEPDSPLKAIGGTPHRTPLGNRLHYVDLRSMSSDAHAHAVVTK
jgi:hypothetical protein